MNSLMGDIGDQIFQGVEMLQLLHGIASGPLAAKALFATSA